MSSMSYEPTEFHGGSEPLAYNDHDMDVEIGVGCPARDPKNYSFCTRPLDHEGIHEAMDIEKKAVARWRDVE